jgi:hypothetical protein
VCGVFCANVLVGWLATGAQEQGGCVEAGRGQDGRAWGGCGRVWGCGRPQWKLWVALCCAFAYHPKSHFLACLPHRLVCGPDKREHPSEARYAPLYTPCAATSPAEALGVRTRPNAILASVAGSSGIRQWPRRHPKRRGNSIVPGVVLLHPLVNNV